MDTIRNVVSTKPLIFERFENAKVRTHIFQEVTPFTSASVRRAKYCRFISIQVHMVTTRILRPTSIVIVKNFF
jgi:hypothetical protein